MSKISKCVQEERRAYSPPLAKVFETVLDAVTVVDPSEKAKKNDVIDDRIRNLFPNNCEKTLVNILTNNANSGTSSSANHPPLRVGIVLSGGQAAGGHNVISGVFDAINAINENSQLIGFLDGPAGIFNCKYKLITKEDLAPFRNMGGFDFLGSGRDKIESEEHLNKSVDTCTRLDLHGLIVVGGDDSNTNAAVLAEHFSQNNCWTKVIGVPKTIDGDLKNEVIETSFGFDTAVKTYSEMISNLVIDAASSNDFYHFVRLMGRSASHITLECALKTCANLTLIGEEIKEKRMSLNDIVDDIVKLIVDRQNKGVYSGVILLPEGLVEFIPEMGELISELNEVNADPKLLKNPHNVELFQSLPSSIREQLILDRDPHGNVQVAKIAMEQLLILMTIEKLPNDSSKKLFHPFPHYFGYEGRCAMPSNFDANYCYNLGYTAATLIDCGLTGYMAIVRNLADENVKNWVPGGAPLTKMMQIERRHGKDKPVIRKYLVELDGQVFKTFESIRDSWRLDDPLVHCGPVQFSGPFASISNFMVVPPKVEDFTGDNDVYSGKFWRNLNSQNNKHSLQYERSCYKPPVASILRSENVNFSHLVKLPAQDQQLTHAIRADFPLLREKVGNSAHYLTEDIQVNNDSPGIFLKEFGDSRATRRPSDAGLRESNRTTSTMSSNKLLLPTTSFVGADNVFSPRENGSSREAVMKSNSSDIKVGVCFNGQQTPGAENILWGLQIRMKLTNGKLVGFKGTKGLVEGDYIDIDVHSNEFHPYRNQGGILALGRCGGWGTEFEVLSHQQNLEKIAQQVSQIGLTSLVLVGGTYTFTDSSILTEFFLKRRINCSVICVPATVNNNIRHPMIECTIGFDSASRTYSSLIGNILTDAASAKKYWYFIRLMGRDPSFTVLEGALQTNPNLVVISEDYARQGKDLSDVTSDIANVVQRRAQQGKNWGVVLIPEGLLTFLPSIKTLMKEIDQGSFSNVSQALFSSLPTDFADQLINSHSKEGRFRMSHIKTEELLSHTVAAELKNRKIAKFSPICHFFGYEGRSALPSDFDCTLGLSHGLLAGIAAEHHEKVTGVCTTIQRLSAQDVNEWKFSVVPITSLMTLVADFHNGVATHPAVPSTTVDIHCKTFRKIQNLRNEWETMDKFRNPGPIQFGEGDMSRPKLLLEEHALYLSLSKQLEDCMKYITDSCGFGVSESLLKTTVLHMRCLVDIINTQQSDGNDTRMTAYLDSIQNVPTEQG